jgi:hypothetical protein
MLLLAYSVQSKPIFTNDGDLESRITVSPSDVREWIGAFLDGFEINKYANATVECRADNVVFYNYLAAGVENYVNHLYFEGSLNVSDALGSLSPLSRNCYNSTAEIAGALEAYFSQFTSVSDFITTVSVHTMSNIYPIRKKATTILAEFLTTQNYTRIAFLSGEIATLVFVLNEKDLMLGRKYSPLGYTEADPLAPNPINDLLWIIFEGAYKFTVNSQLASKQVIQQCQEGTLNMVLLNGKALDYWRTGDRKNAWFTFADGLTFAHQIVDGCYHTGVEISTTVENIKEHGQISKNLLSNLFFVISGLMGTWSQIYHQDWLNMIGVLGGLTYKVFVYGAN